MNVINVKGIYKLMQICNYTKSIVSTSRNYKNIFCVYNTGSIIYMKTHPTDLMTIKTKINVLMNRMHISGYILVR